MVYNLQEMDLAIRHKIGILHSGAQEAKAQRRWARVGTARRWRHTLGVLLTNLSGFWLDQPLRKHRAHHQQMPRWGWRALKLEKLWHTVDRPENTHVPCLDGDGRTTEDKGLLRAPAVPISHRPRPLLQHPGAPHACIRTFPLLTPANSTTGLEALQ